MTVDLAETGTADTLTWLLCDLVSGDVLAELPLVGTTVGRRLSDKVDGSWTFGPTDIRTPVNWPELIDPEDERRMVVAVHYGKPVQAWAITEVDTSWEAPQIAGPSLEGLLERVFVRDYEAYNVDEAFICSEILDQVFSPGFNFTTLAFSSGTVKDVYYDGAVDLTLRALLDEYKPSDPPIDFVCDVQWYPGAEGKQIKKVIRVGADLGRVDPDLVFDSSAIASYSRKKSFGEGFGATRLWSVSDGSGSARPMEGPFEHPNLATMGPWETRESFATATDEADLATRGSQTMAGRMNGTAIWEFVCQLDRCPRLVDDWDVGDVATFIVDPSEMDPTGGEHTGVIVGWDADFSANTITLTLKTGTGPMTRPPTSNGIDQLWATLDDLRAWRRQMRSSAGVLSNGTVSVDGGITIVGDGSIVSDNGGQATRVRNGVVEVRESPGHPWVPFETVILDQVPSDPTALPATAPVLAIAPFAVGALTGSWEAVDDAEWYDIYASLDPDFDPTDIANRVVEGVTGLSAVVSTIAGAQIPVDGTPVYVAVRAVNRIGAGPASDVGSGTARQADAEFLSSLMAWFGTVEAQRVLVGELNAAISISTDGIINVGTRITIADPNAPDDKGGITIWGDDEHTIVLARLHPDGNYLDGILVAQDITVIQALRLIGDASAIASGAKVKIENGIADPANGPTLTQGTLSQTWPSLQSHETERGITWNPDTGLWYQVIHNENNRAPYIRTISDTGVASAFSKLPLPSGFTSYNTGGIASVGTQFYVWVDGAASFGDGWFLLRYTLTSGGPTATYSGRTAVAVDGPYLGWPVVAAYGGVVYASAGDGETVDRWNSTLTSASTVTIPGTAVSTSSSMVAGSFDLGSAQIGFVNRTTGDVLYFAISTWSGTLAATTSATWKSDGRWVGYKSSGTNQGFYSSKSDAKLTRYSSYYPTSGEKWWVQYNDKGASGVTAVSPERSLAVTARRFLTVALRPAEIGVTGSDVFVGYGSTSPGTTKKKRTESLTGRTMTLTGGKITGTDTMPTVNTMGGSPGELFDDFGNSWKGNGVISVITPTLPTQPANKAYADAILPDGGWLTPGLSAGWSAASGFGFRKIGNVVYFRGELFGGTLGSNIFALPVGSRPSARVGTAIYRAVTASLSTAGFLTISTDGLVVIRDYNGGASSPGLSLSHVSFVVA